MSKFNFTGLSLDQIRERAPSVFATGPSKRASDQYKFISTLDVLEALMAKGFQVADASQRGYRKGEKGATGRHMLRLRLPGKVKPIVGKAIPEILFGNSHDTTRRAWMSAGVFRIACANGLIVGTSLMDTVTTIHQGDISLFLEGVQHIVDTFPELASTISTWSNLELTTAQQLEFASQAQELAPTKLELNVEQLLVPRREADKPNDLFTVMNRVQEAIVRGGTEGTTKQGRVITTKSLASFDKGLRFNRAIWDLTAATAAKLA